MRAAEDSLQVALVQAQETGEAWDQGIQVFTCALPWVPKPDLNPAVWNTSLSSQFCTDSNARDLFLSKVSVSIEHCDGDTEVHFLLAFLGKHS